MRSLYELTEKIFNEFFVDVQNDYSSINIKELLYEYLNKKYKILVSEISIEDTKSFMLEEWYKSERKKLVFMTAQQKIGMISIDQYLIAVEDASRIIFGIAMDKKMLGKIDGNRIKQAETLVQKILKDIAKVNEVNMAIAQKSLSEARIEFNYIKGISNNISFRMANALKYRN